MVSAAVCIQPPNVKILSFDGQVDIGKSLVFDR